MYIGIDLGTTYSVVACKDGDTVKVIDNLATIDYDKCTDCGACVEGCPTHCLHRL